jgi:photosystem II stability/assembly factor-like uncharacterized protein
MRKIVVGAALLTLPAPATAAEWEPVTDGLAKKEGAGFGGLCGVLVHRDTGRLYLNVSDKGLYRSDDGGKTWSPYAVPFKGRTEWPGCMTFDPTGNKAMILVATVYGGPPREWSLKGEDWREMDKRASHVDWCVVNWTPPGLDFVLALKHESGGLMIVSHDGGKTFEDVGKGYAAAWIFDAKTAVAAEMKSKEKPKPGLVRTTDGGKTWKPCGDFSTQALPKWRDGTLYWVVDGALIATTDKGENWRKIRDLKDGKYGPIFGKTAKQMFVLTAPGVIETTDGGATWSKALPLPKEMKGWSPLTWLEYDPVNDVLYVVKMGSELYRMGRK